MYFKEGEHVSTIKAVDRIEIETGLSFDMRDKEIILEILNEWVKTR